MPSWVQGEPGRSRRNLQRKKRVQPSQDRFRRSQSTTKKLGDFFLHPSQPTNFFPTSRLLAVARSIHTLFGMHVPFVETLELILLVAEKGPVHSPIRRHDFFSRPTAAGSRQVVYQAGKTIALCKFTELRQWQHAKSRLKP